MSCADAVQRNNARRGDLFVICVALPLAFPMRLRFIGKLLGLINWLHHTQTRIFIFYTPARISKF
ncbi:MAG: hypothetical protein E5W72_01640 [Mesorhizobium sp.]|uniref:hypothetical protein n=1 Tax=Mesorhizobium sp. TaxID=1871066 RepID=UPI0011F7A354|nr:hypothetical protein [Mesorhizobium sp.]TIT04032.1 MAG: hypothetical protein E5W87_02720 [Mesorhizobium sp.]TIT54958.1 MAG: hypothetical protein E5W72_01640 [Mesorhizobium sp.]